RPSGSSWPPCRRASSWRLCGCDGARPGSSIYDKIGTYDMTTDDTYYERGINLRPEDSHNICIISIQRQEDSIKVLCLCNENGIKGTLQANAHAGVRLHALPDGGHA